MKILSAVAAIIFLVAVGAMAQTNSSFDAVPFLGDIPQFHLTTNELSDAEIQGRQLVQKLLEQAPTTNSVQTGILKIRDGKGKTSEIPIKFETIITATNWSSIYELSPVDIVSNAATPIKLVVLHDSSNSNYYRLTFSFGGNPERLYTKGWSHNVTIFSFAGDFGVADLGLEFFHWPGQKILKRENRRSRGCAVLESTNPYRLPNGDFFPNAYSRVVSWIDEESGGIVHAEAYDAQNKLLKVFDPKSFKKVNGQWQPELMEMENVQTGSRTWIDFNPGPLRPPKG